MTSAAGQKGKRAEREAAAELEDLLGYPVRRKLQEGRAEDHGDLEGLPNCTIQVKNFADTSRALREGVAGAVAQQAAAGTLFGAAMIRRRGGGFWVAMSVEQFATLYREATA